MMGNRSGLIALSDAVRDYFDRNRIPASVPPVGFRARTQWGYQGPGGGSRVCFLPGEYDGGLDARPLRGGTLRKGRHTHDTRELAWWEKAVTVSVWGADPDHPTDEEAQIAATEDLLEATIQAAHHAVDPETDQPVGLADLIWGEVTWTLPPGERAFGRELLVSLIHNGPLFDVPIETTTPRPMVARNPSS